MALPVTSATWVVVRLQFALSVMSSGCYEDDADDGEVMTLTGQSMHPVANCIIPLRTSNGHARKHPSSNFSPWLHNS